MNFHKIILRSMIALGASKALLASDQGEVVPKDKSALFAAINQVLPVKDVPRIVMNYMGVDHGRPEAVQLKCDEAFESNRCAWGDWLYNGSSSYGLLGFDDKKLLKYVVNRQIDNSDVYILDIGCATGAWGKNALRVLKGEGKKRNVRVTIFSITGGNECDNKMCREENITLYQFNQIKIENIDEELAKKGFNLRNQVNLIVSSWTLRHLVDPFGTLKRLYQLLSPARGLLLSNGFFFMLDGSESDEPQAFPAENNLNFLKNSNAIPLFKQSDYGRNADDFLLMRVNKRKLNLPLIYTGKIKKLSWGYQCESRKATVFKIKQLIASKSMEENCCCLSLRSRHYCDKDNEKSKKIYAALLKNDLFYKGKGLF